jgi:hypothetical protein
LKKKTERGIEGGIAEGWEKSVAVCSLGRYGGEKRMELPRRLEMKELSPERAIIHSWTERGSWIRRCTRARFRGMGGVLRENSRLVISMAMESTLDSQNRKTILFFGRENPYRKLCLEHNVWVCMCVQFYSFLLPIKDFVTYL